MEARINQTLTLSTTYCSPFVVVDNQQWHEQCRRLISSCPNTIGFLWRRELINRRHSAQHCPLANRSACCWKSTVICGVPTAIQFLPKDHMISMEERIARSSALSTTSSTTTTTNIHMMLSIETHGLSIETHARRRISTGRAPSKKYCQAVFGPFLVGN
jgi:hypothetical protein